MSKALFANQRETNLASIVLLVEEVLAERDVVDPVEDKAAIKAWRIGNEASVSLIDRSEFSHIRVQAAVMGLDDKVDRATLFAELLAHNAQLCGAAFATDGDRVLLVCERSTIDLDKSEVRELIERVLAYVTQHAAALVSRHGGAAI